MAKCGNVTLTNVRVGTGSRDGPTRSGIFKAGHTEQFLSVKSLFLRESMADKGATSKEIQSIFGDKKNVPKALPWERGLKSVADCSLACIGPWALSQTPLLQNRSLGERNVKVEKIY